MAKIAPLTGVGFIVLAIVSIALGGEPPEASEGATAVVEHYVDNKDSIIFSAVVGTLAVALLVFFGATLAATLRNASGEGGILATVVAIGAAIMAVGLAIDSTISFALAEAAEDIEPASVQTLQALWDNDFLPIALGTFLFLLASGLAIVRTRALPVWLGWVAIALTVIALTPLGFIAFLGSAIWVLIVSILLTMRTPSEAPPPPAQTQTVASG